MTKFLIITIILTLVLSCSTAKGPYTYEVCVKQDTDSSKITKNEMIGIADTTSSFLSGQVIDLKTKETLVYANVTLKEKDTEKIYGQVTNSLGQFSITLPAGDYDFEVKYVGYSPIERNLKFGPGEIRKIEIELGLGEAFVAYEIKCEKRLTRRQLNKRTEELKKGN